MDHHRKPLANVLLEEANIGEVFGIGMIYGKQNGQLISFSD